MSDTLRKLLAPYVPEIALDNVVTTAALVLSSFILCIAMYRVICGGHRKGPSRLTKSLFAVNSSIADTKTAAGKYEELYTHEESDQRKEENSELVDNFYNLVTDFYLFGWGERFHFAPRLEEESLEDSFRRHEYWMASQLGIDEKMKVLDVGCGVGGPARTIARFSNAHVTGISLNQYQIEVGKKQTEKAGLSHLVELVQGNFMELPFADNTFDAIYDIEAICHSGDQQRCYQEIMRVLKPGGVFGSYLWVTNENYNGKNAEHRRVKHSIERGNGLPELLDAQHYYRSAVNAGLHVDKVHDVASDHVLSPLPWYQPFVDGWLTTPFSIMVTNKIVYLLEKLRIVPQGTHSIHSYLYEAAVSLLEGGKREIFSPMLFMKSRKAV
eukprot:gb/GECG01016731.1/.p1 GENE.gb/GECG01016731.1/~~gb/GECG01016731.1/.p1  ORF type:complete len:383 (+),score=42.56 gb/GECG01016731.1/:1-1149(+)